MMHRIACFLCALAIACGAPSASYAARDSAARRCDVAAPQAPLAPRTFVFPRDDGAHAGFAVEWWRTFGRVSDATGKQYDFTVNVSRFAVDACARRRPANQSRWSARHIVTTTYELLDEDAQHVERGTYVEREGILGAKVGTSSLALRAGTLAFANLSDVPAARRMFRLDFGGDEANALHVTQTPSSAALPLGPGGVMRTGSCTGCAAYAYAYPRVTTRGVLRIDGTDHAVSGSTWFEHEFAHRELGPADVGWDRFEVQFDDGRDVDARFTRRADGSISTTSGVFVSADGRVSYLRVGDAGASNFPPHSTWSSVSSGVTYPSVWFLGVRPGHLGLATVEVERDQESRAPGRAPFYCGAIVVEKAAPPGGDPGHGYVELTGYGTPLSF